MRLDDKLCRIMRGDLTAATRDNALEDTVRDLVGYIILLRVSRRMNGAKVSG